MKSPDPNPDLGYVPDVDLSRCRGSLSGAYPVVQALGLVNVRGPDPCYRGPSTRI
jgi:hypothetical protein